MMSKKKERVELIVKDMNIKTTSWIMKAPSKVLLGRKKEDGRTKSC